MNCGSRPFYRHPREVRDALRKGEPGVIEDEYDDHDDNDIELKDKDDTT